LDYLALSDTPLGRIQRGLGSGFLWAMRQPPATVRALLEQCILNDPRLDHQVESRGDYYAQLVLGTGMDLAPLEHRLRNDDDRDYTESKALLPIETLGALAKRGYRKATRILRDYVRHGFNWEGGLQELSEAGEQAWAGLDEVLRERFPDDASFLREMPWMSEDEPWTTWQKPGSPLASAIQAVRTERRKHEAEPIDPSLTTEEILDTAERRRNRLIDVLKSRDFDGDREILLAAIDLSRPWRAIAALTALTPIADPRVYRLAKGIIEQWHRDPKRQPAVLRSVAAKALAALPSDMVLSLARRWRSSPAWKYRRTAYTILENHATAEDLPWVRRQLRKPITYGRIYQFGDLAEIVEKFPGSGRYPQLRRLYQRFPYSYGRSYVVRAMAATDSLFPRGLAYECLWDCESRTRKVACGQVDLSVKGAKARIESLAADAFEDKAVREAAEACLR